MFIRFISSIILVLLLLNKPLLGQSKADGFMPVRAFCIAAPKPRGINKFISFIETELAPRNVNTIILRIDFNYRFQNYSKLRDVDALSKKDIDKIVNVCQSHKIDLIPQINMFGHQSWDNKVGKLLKAYPEFDETPHVKIPQKYEWPNKDSLYCKSYCPLHEKVHKVVFDLVDEICDAFKAKAFHAGMDEILYIGDARCPRCANKNKADLFAGEVNLFQKHLSSKRIKLWIWGDRLLDGSKQGLGMWEASMNNTHKAIDLISKDVVICDWHYEEAKETPPYFASKGFNVISCAWQNPSVAATQTQNMIRWRNTSEPSIKTHYLGTMQTVWISVNAFLTQFAKEEKGNTESNCFREMFKL